jgi:hypothetical protein
LQVRLGDPERAPESVSHKLLESIQRRTVRVETLKDSATLAMVKNLMRFALSRREWWLFLEVINPPR